MGVLINVMNQFKTRIQDGVDDGDLGAITSVRFGNIEEIRKQEHCPFIVISIGSITSNAERLTHKISNSMEVIVSLVDNKLTNDDYNTFYDETNEKGVLYLFEKFLDVIFTDTSGSVNLGFNSTVRSALAINTVVDEKERVIIFSTTFTVDVKDALYGQASN